MAILFPPGWSDTVMAASLFWRWSGLVALCLALLYSPLSVLADEPTSSDDAAERKPLRIHMISGSGEYQSAPSLTKWAAHLEARYEVKVTLSMARDGGNTIPDLEGLEDADLLVVFCRRIRVPEDQLEKLKAWCEAGKPVIGIRTASHAFQTWLAFDNEVLGGTYSGHGGQEELRNQIVKDNADHPILKGVESWAQVDKLYYNPPRAGGRHGQAGAVTPEDLVALLRTEGRSSGNHNTAWCWEYNKEKKGRSFYVSPGYPHHFENENYLRLLKNAIEWTTRRTLVEKPDEEPGE
jgi:type 1 glutamine amidotransferase